MRLCQTSIQSYYAYFAKALGKAVVVTSDNSLSSDDSSFVVEEIGGTKANNISWKSKKIDAGEPAIPKALGSVAIVYEASLTELAAYYSAGSVPVLGYIWGETSRPSGGSKEPII